MDTRLKEEIKKDKEKAKIFNFISKSLDKRQKDLEKKEENLQKENPSKKRPSYLEPKRVLTSEEYKQYKKHRVEKRRLKLLEDIRREKPMTRAISRINRYENSRSGSISRGIQKGFKFIKSPARALYLTPEERVGDYSGTKPQRMNAIALWRARQAQQERIRMQQQQAQAQAQAAQRYNELFRAGDLAAPIVERETCSPLGYANEGSNMARFTEAQAFHTANFNTVYPLSSVSREVNFFSNFIDAKPNLDIDTEVLGFANNPFLLRRRR